VPGLLAGPPLCAVLTDLSGDHRSGRVRLVDWLGQAVWPVKTTEEDDMSEAQGTTGRPWHLWLIGIVGVLWSSMGVISFMLTQMKIEAVMSRFPPQQREYFESFPLWAVAFWALGVFGGVIGCLLLLLKNRLAFPVLLLSLIGTTVSSLGGLLLLGGMAVMRETGGLGLTVFPVIVAAFLAYYARAMSKKGVR
jgi:hypothetical protein